MRVTKGLIIADPWIGYILRGTKDWEMRSSGASHRGWFGLIRKGTGAVYGVARLIEVGAPLAPAEMIATFEHHGIPERMIRSGEVAKWNTPWKLADVRRLDRPVADAYFGAGQAKLVDCVRLAQIAAKLGATIGASFRYAAADRTLRRISQDVLFDEDGTLEALLPKAVQGTQLLHPDYVANFSSCSRDEWLNWVGSGRAGLHTFAPLSSTRTSVYGRARITAEAQSRGQRGTLSYHYKTDSFIVEDWEFGADYWKHWQAASASDPGIWAKVAVRILGQRENYWSKASGARIVQVATTGSTRAISWEPLAAGWALKLRDKPCLPDTRDVVQVPADLLRRTPETESLIDVEPFVHGLLDREAARPLLDLLGVRRTPSGPGQLLKRLRALAGSERAPAHEVEKWYRRLDQMLDGCSTVDAQSIKDAFKAEKLILAQDGTWATSGGIFLAGDEEDVPGAAVVRASVLDLSLWRRIGIADRPSADLALQWLGTLASGKALTADDARRVRTLLARYPTRVWEERGHWINLSGEWVPTGTLVHALSMQSLFTYGHLHDWVKRRTADFRQLSADLVRSAPFSSLGALSDLVEERFNQPSLLAGPEDRRTWLTAFGTQLGRIELADPAETARVRTLAAEIAATTWVATSKLEVIPYLDGVPAGTARLTDILWLDGKLFASALSKAKLAKRVPEEIGKNLNADIRAALAYAFERSPEDIRSYLEENFTLGPQQQTAGLIAETRPIAARAFADAADDPSGDTDAAGRGNDDLIPSELDETEGDELPVAPEPGRPTSDEGWLDSEVVSRPRPPARPPRPSVMARYALAKGYRADGEDRFFHSDGSWIGRANGARFPWERRSVGGEILRHYYPKEHCLERDPLQVEADVWGLLDQKPDNYSFILVNPEGEPVEMTGARLRALRDGGEITIHPATYRLVYDLDD